MHLPVAGSTDNSAQFSLLGLVRPPSWAWWGRIHSGLSVVSPKDRKWQRITTPWGACHLCSETLVHVRLTEPATHGIHFVQAAAPPGFWSESTHHHAEPDRISVSQGQVALGHGNRLEACPVAGVCVYHTKPISVLSPAGSPRSRGRRSLTRTQSLLILAQPPLVGPWSCGRSYPMTSMPWGRSTTFGTSFK